MRMTDDPDEWARIARDAIGRGDLARARALAAARTRDHPGESEAWFILALVEAESGRVAAALPLLDAAIEAGATAEHHAQRARLLILLRREAPARAAADAAAAFHPDDALTLDTIGCVYARLGDHEAAVAMFEQAVPREPENAGFRYNLAAALGFLGRTDAAVAAFETLLAQAPDNARAHFALSGLRKQSAQDNHVARLERALAAATAADDRLRLHYALAKEHEDIGAAAPAFAHLKQANDARKREIGYDFAADAAIFDAIEAAFDAQTPSPGAGIADASPFFIVGMPRTGTTLVDRILSSHPMVGSAGELQAMPLAVKQLAGTRSRLIIDPETVRASMLAAPAAIGSAYLARAAEQRPAGSAHFIDKLPANFLYVGHIARALPAARIICLRRNPLDTIWSNYKNLFASGSAYYHYSYDLEDIARYFLRFDRLMAHWRRLFPGRILELHYEELVAAQEAESRRLIAHCGLDWSDACLDFHENRAPVATPSAAQVRRPIYRDAVERWRAHADQLAPARRLLEQAGVAID